MHTGSSFKKFIVAVSVSTALVLAAVAGLWILYATVQRLVGKLSALESKIDLQQDERRQAGEFSKLLEEHRDDFARVEGFLIDRKNPIPFIERFEALAIKTKTTIAIDVDDLETEDSSLHFRFMIDGVEQNARAMLELIEHAPYYLTIDSILIQRASEGNASVSVTTGERQSVVRLIISLHVKTL